MKKKTTLKEELEHLHKTRKNNMKICIYQKFERGIEYWIFLDEYKRDDVQEELKELQVLGKKIENKSEYIKNKQRIIALEIE